MKKIVPFKKDITLDTNIAGINSISLEHTLDKKDENIISGDFIISGTYKMTPSSINLDNFEYKLPVNITIDGKYDIQDVTVDINDFYYEVINDRILSINIEVVIDNLEEKKIPSEDKGKIKKEVLNMDTDVNETLETDEKSEERQEIPDNNVQENVSNEIKELGEEVRDTAEAKSIFSGVNSNDNYVVYKIHVVTENDTIENIMEDYQINREVLEAYNDLSNLKVGDKLIIADNGN